MRQAERFAVFIDHVVEFDLRGRYAKIDRYLLLLGNCGGLFLAETDLNKTKKQDENRCDNFY